MFNFERKLFTTSCLLVAQLKIRQFTLVNILLKCTSVGAELTFLPVNANVAKILQRTRFLSISAIWSSLGSLPKSPQTTVGGSKSWNKASELFLFVILLFQSYSDLSSFMIVKSCMARLDLSPVHERKSDTVFRSFRTLSGWLVLFKVFAWFL